MGGVEASYGGSGGKGLVLKGRAVADGGFGGGGGMLKV